jgi:hypothetical protein
MTVVIPHADRVVRPFDDAECRYCGKELDNEANYLGVSDKPTDHVAYECDDCDFLVAELIEDQPE